MFIRNFKCKSNTMLIIAVIIIFIVNINVASANQLSDLLSSIYRGFRHVGLVRHEHSFSATEGAIRFVAIGQGVVGGSHDAWSRDSDSADRSMLNSFEYYRGVTERTAVPDQFMVIGNRYTIAIDHSALNAILIKPNGMGLIQQTISSKSEPGVGQYFKQNKRIETTDGTTVIRSSFQGSDTNLEVEGYSEYSEVVIVESGGVKTGWWDLN